MASAEPKVSFSLGNIIGWFFGALSLVDLIHDLDLIELQGKIEKWVAAYDYFVQSISEFLFGWIHLSWIEITEKETHFFIITSIICATISRSLGDFDKPIYKEKINHAKNYLLGLILLIFFVLILLLLVEPNSYVAISISIFYLATLLYADKGKSFLIVCVVNIFYMQAIFLIIVALNYSIFS